MRASLKDKIKKVKLLILDVDGVMTNGEIVIDERGGEIKIFNVQDGYAIVLFKRAGFKTAILSARSTGAVTARANDLKIDKIYQDANPKINDYKRLLRIFKLKDNEVCFVGDDLPDIEVLRRVGFSVTVPNAASEVKKIVDHITKQEGGKGAVREVIELILKIQGKWSGIIKRCGA